jgi:hypothetical protein
MKNTETDKELADLIRTTLEAHEEQYVLGSWELFQRQRVKRRKVIFWFTASGIAASLLLGLLGYRLLFPDLEIFRGESKRMLASAEHTLPEALIIKPAKISDQKNEIHSGSYKMTATIRNETGSVSHNSVAVSSNSVNSAAAIVPPQISDISSDTATNRVQTETSESEIRKVGLASGQGSLPETGKQQEQSRLPGKIDSTSVKPVIRYDYLKQLPEETVAVNSQSSKIRLGVNLSPGVASVGSSSSFAFSGGLNAEYGFTGNLGLATGLQFEYQSVTEQSQDGPAWLPAGETQAVLLDFDLPLNLVWKFLSMKSTSYYVGGGVSSVLYLSEKYTTSNYTQRMVGSVALVDGVPNVNIQLENVKSSVEESEKPLNAFDPAGRINLIFGIEQKFSSKLRLHVEPYMKIPVSGLASRNMKYTFSGVSCKVSF